MRHRFLKKGLWKNLDWPTLITICILFFIGLITLVNVTASPFTGEESSTAEIFEKLNLSYAVRQLVFFIAGLVMIFVVTLIDYHALTPYIKWMYLGSIALLVAVLFFGSEQRGTNGWFMIGSFGFQPGELCKIFIIIVAAKSVARETDPGGPITEFRQVIPSLVLVAIPALLIMAQPDLGTACVYIFFYVFILFMAKTSWRVLLLLLLMAAMLFPVMWFSLEEYQKTRLFTFLDPNFESSDAGLQVAQAQMALGSGQFWGKGLFAPGSLSQLGYVPEHHNDFIFAVTIETFGMFGGMIILALYAFLIVRTFMLAMRAKDDFGSFIIVGVGAMMFFHVLENVGMNLGILPVTGIGLPFFSYGGSNLLTSMIAYGMVLSVDMRRGRWKTM